MHEFSNLGKNLIILGVILLGVGVFLWLGGGISGLGRLPGDILIKKGNFTFYLPLMTCILLSLLLTLILALWRR